MALCAQHSGLAARIDNTERRIKVVEDTLRITANEMREEMRDGFNRYAKDAERFRMYLILLSVLVGGSTGVSLFAKLLF